MEQLVARWAHNPEVGGSSPPPATIMVPWVRAPSEPPLFGFIAQSVEQRTENPCVGGSIPPGTTIREFKL